MNLTFGSEVILSNLVFVRFGWKGPRGFLGQRGPFELLEFTLASQELAFVRFLDLVTADGIQSGGQGSDFVKTASDLQQRRPILKSNQNSMDMDLYQYFLHNFLPLR